MNDKDIQTAPKQRVGLRGHAAAIIALFALAVVAVAWFWTTRQPMQETGHGVIVLGGGAFVTACVAYIRNMDASDVLEMLGDLAYGLLSIIGAILQGIWNRFLGMLGWD